MKTIINFSEFDKVQIGNINQTTVLTLNKGQKIFYFPIPSVLNYTIINGGIEILCGDEQNFPVYNTFLNLLNEIKENNNSVARKKLLLKGLGLRSNFDETARTLTFKLGYSHLCVLPVPECIRNIKIKKNVIFLESSDKILLGNFAKKIHQLKESDIYKGKGFSYQYENKKLKIIKKK